MLTGQFGHTKYPLQTLEALTDQLSTEQVTGKRHSSSLSGLRLGLILKGRFSFSSERLFYPCYPTWQGIVTPFDAQQRRAKKKQH